MNVYIAFCLVIVLASKTNEVQGASCSCNCNDGGSSCPSNPVYPTASSSTKQCVFPQMNEDKDVGVIRTCKFTKAESHTSLRITFTGNMRVIGCAKGCCRRWFLTVNGQECKDPATIDTQLYANGGDNRHAPGILDGFCNNVPKGPVTVGLSIAVCPGATPGDAYTGWYSVSRFVIMEVPPLQS